MRCSKCQQDTQLLCFCCSLDPAPSPALRGKREQLAALQATYNTLMEKHPGRLAFSGETGQINRANRMMKVKQRIECVERAMGEERERERMLVQSQKEREEIMGQMKKENQLEGQKNNQNDTQVIYLEDLKRRNQARLNQIAVEQEDRLTIIRKLMKILKFEDKKFILQKYIKLRTTENILYTTEEYQGNGIPFIVAENEEVLSFDLSDEEEEKIEQENRIASIMYEGAKMVAIIHKSFLPKVQLPYKIVVGKSGVYIGNFGLSRQKISQREFSRQQLQTFLSRVQANVDLMAWVIGSPNRPLLILDQIFLQKLKSNNFSPFGTRENRWKSKLRELTQESIMREEQEYIHDEPIEKLMKMASDEPDLEFMIPDLKCMKSWEPEEGGLESLEQSHQNSEADDDDSFQLLQ